MIEDQYNETVQVNRFVDIAGTNRKVFEVHIESLQCMIQPLDDNITTDIEGGFGKDLLMFCKVADIKEGDRVLRDVDESGVGKQYRVTGVQKYDFMGKSHMEVSIRIFE